MNAFMSAVDRDGRTQWSNRLEAAGFSRSTAVDLDDAGNIYVSGWVSGVLAGQTQVGATDAFVGKYGPGGELIWARQFGTPDEERALDVVVGPGGAAWLVGWTRGVFLDQGEVPKRTVLVRRDGFARAYDGTGKALWTRQFGTLKDQSANGVALEDPFRRPAGQDPPQREGPPSPVAWRSQSLGWYGRHLGDRRDFRTPLRPGQRRGHGRVPGQDGRRPFLQCPFRRPAGGDPPSGKARLHQ